MELSPTGHCLHHLETPAVLLDDGAADGEAHSHSLFLGREKGIEDALGDLEWNSRSIVGDDNLYARRTMRSRAHAQHRLPIDLSLHGLGGVVKQIEQHLMQLT